VATVRAATRGAAKSASKKPARGGASQRPRRRVLVLSGPNLHRLGKREPGIYGKATLDDIHRALGKTGDELGVEVDCRQSNHEGTLVDWIGQCADEGFSGVVINPAAFTHTSLALYDALLCAGVPAVEVHLSNPAAREEFRHRSFTAAACVGSVAGFGPQSYELGLRALVGELGKRRKR